MDFLVLLRATFVSAWTTGFSLFFLVASASAQWSAPHTLGVDIGNPRVAVSKDGTKAIAVWSESNGSIVSIRGSVAAISGGRINWGTPQDIAATQHWEPVADVAISADGSKAIVEWEDRLSPQAHSLPELIKSATATIVGKVASWSAPTTISVSALAGYQHIALSDDGSRATITWIETISAGDGDYVVQSRSAAISSNISSWGATVDVSPRGNYVNSLDFVLSSDGSAATAMWSVGLDTSYIQSSSAYITVNSAIWSSPKNLTALEAGSAATSPKLALSDDGSVVVAMWRTNIGLQTAAAAVRSGVATWSPALDQSAPPGFYNDEGEIRLSSDGTRAAAAWTQIGRRASVIQSRFGTVSGNVLKWSSTSSLTSPGPNALWAVSLGLSANGSNAVAMWSYTPTGKDSVVQSSSATFTGTKAKWTVPIRVSRQGEIFARPKVEVARSGSGVGLWIQKIRGRYLLQSAAYKSQHRGRRLRATAP